MKLRSTVSSPSLLSSATPASGGEGGAEVSVTESTGEVGADDDAKLLGLPSKVAAPVAALAAAAAELTDNCLAVCPSVAMEAAAMWAAAMWAAVLALPARWCALSKARGLLFKGWVCSERLIACAQSVAMGGCHQTSYHRPTVLSLASRSTYK